MLASLLTIKNGIYAVIILAVVGGIWYTLDDWHYSRVRELETCETDQISIVKFHESEIKLRDINISNLDTDLEACFEDTKSAYSDGYYKGLSNAGKITVPVYTNYSF